MPEIERWMSVEVLLNDKLDFDKEWHEIDGLLTAFFSGCLSWGPQIKPEISDNGCCWCSYF
jgi:hypothetical protein